MAHRLESRGRRAQLRIDGGLPELLAPSSAGRLRRTDAFDAAGRIAGPFLPPPAHGAGGGAAQMDRLRRGRAPAADRHLRSRTCLQPTPRRTGARWPMRGFSISGADTADTCAPWCTSPIQKICTAAIHGLHRWPDATRTVCSATLRRHSFCRSIFRFWEHLISSTPSPFSRIFWHVLRVKPRCIARLSKTGRRARHNDSPDRILDHCQRDGRGKMSA